MESRTDSKDPRARGSIINNKMEEIWKSCVGLESTYIASNLGNIRHVNSSNNRKVYYAKSLPNKKGMPSGIVTVRVNGKPRTLSIHILIAKTFLPNPNNYPEVNHIDGNRTHNWVSNLEWCTGSYNMYHAYKTGLREYPRQLTEEQLTQLHAGLEAGLDQHAMARALNIDASSISNIVTQNTYKTINLDFSKFSKSYYTNKAREQLTDIIAKHNSGISSDKLGKEYNVSGRFIRSLLR